jgi:hypothetical protein
VLDDEGEEAEELAGDEDEGEAGVDEGELDALELLPALVSLKKTRMERRRRGGSVSQLGWARR